jgi:hypothetical protein
MRRKNIVSYFIDVLGYSANEVEVWTDEELGNMVDSLTEAQYEDLEAWCKPIKNKDKS